MRLFTGISIPSPVRDALGSTIASLKTVAPLQWTPLSNLHITTKFIGEWPGTRLPELQQSLLNIALQPFDMQVARFGFFPNPHRPHTFFAGVQSGAELDELASRVNRELVSLGIPMEKKPYHPHVTLARIRNQPIVDLREKIATMDPVHFGTFRVASFHLYVSETANQAAGSTEGSVRGSVYTVLDTYPAGKEDLPS